MKGKWRHVAKLARRIGKRYGLSRKQRWRLQGQCLIKTKHTPQSVSAIIAWKAAAYGLTLYPYLCPYCNCLHVSKMAHQSEDKRNG